MSAKHIARIAAGFFILPPLSQEVGGRPLFAGKNFLWFTTFAGLNLFQNGFANICPLTCIPAKFVIKSDANR